MKRIETNEWLVLNNLIYKIYTTEDLDQMRIQFLEQLKLLIDFDGADFFLAGDEDSQHLTKPVSYHCDTKDSILYDEIDYSRGIMYSGKSMVYRETDILPDEERVETEYYKRVYKANNWHYSLQVVLGKEHHFLGVATLYRTIGKDNFEYEDIFLVDMLKEHLAYRLYKNASEEAEIQEKLTINEASERFELTKREKCILTLLLQGKGNEEICEELRITINTLKKHILNVYRKLGIRNRVQMFKMVRERP